MDCADEGHIYEVVPGPGEAVQSIGPCAICGSLPCVLPFPYGEE